MAKAKFTMPEDFLLKVSRLAEHTDEIVPRVLEAGAEVVEAQVRENLKSVIGSGTKEESQSTGQLVAALGTSAARQDRDGNFDVKIGFAENRNDGKSNAMIANVLEYGKVGQPPKPFLKAAVSASKEAATQAMVNKLESEVDKI